MPSSIDAPKIDAAALLRLAGRSGRSMTGPERYVQRPESRHFRKIQSPIPDPTVTPDAFVIATIDGTAGRAVDPKREIG